MERAKIKSIEIDSREIQFIDGEVWREPSCEYVPNPRNNLVARTDGIIHFTYKSEEIDELLNSSINSRKCFLAKILIETDELLEGDFLCASAMKNSNEIYPEYYEYDSVLIER